jgi:hypothetical protein
MSTTDLAEATESEAMATMTLNRVRIFIRRQGSD